MMLYGRIGIKHIHSARMLLSKEEIARYKRQLVLPELGEEGQVKISNSKVLIIGAGGLGSPCLLYLAAAGVGTIGIVDQDNVETSNLQRQIIFKESDQGKSKAKIAEAQLRQLNSNIKIVAYNTFLTPNNAIELTQNYDLIIDGSDNFETRYLVNDACVINQKAFVSGSILGFQGQLSVYNYKEGPTYRCLFPEPPSLNDSPNCNEAGVIGALAGIVGSYMAMEAIKVVSNVGEVLSGTLLSINLLNNQINKVKFSAIKENKQLKEIKAFKNDSCETSQMSYEEYEKLKAINEAPLLLDVRTKEEHLQFNIGGTNIPLDELITRQDELNSKNSYLIYCKSGVRSSKAATHLKRLGFKNLMELKGGVDKVKANLVDPLIPERTP